MSGGRFDYVDSRCKSEIFGWADKPTNVFEDKEISARHLSRRKGASDGY